MFGILLTFTDFVRYYDLVIRNFRELNNEQSSELGKLCFDLAKAALIIAFFPTQTPQENLAILIIKMTAGLFWGLVFIYIGLLILKRRK